jgi:hypothetical protein
LQKLFSHVFFYFVFFLCPGQRVDGLHRARCDWVAASQVMWSPGPAHTWPRGVVRNRPHGRSGAGARKLDSPISMFKPENEREWVEITEWREWLIFIQSTIIRLSMREENIGKRNLLPLHKKGIHN